MRHFAIVLTALLAVCAASSALAQSSIAEQMRALRERRAGGAANTNGAPAAEPAPQGTEQAAQEPAPATRVDTGSVTATGEATMADQMQLLREQAHRERVQAGD